MTKPQITTEFLKEQSFLNDKIASILIDLLNKEASFLICGPAGAGKTTLLEWMINNTTGEALLIQDYDEIQPERSNVEAFKLKREEPNIYNELFEKTLDYENVFFGDIKNKEADIFCQPYKRVIGCIHNHIVGEANIVHYLAYLACCTESSIAERLQKKNMYIVEINNFSVVGIYRISKYIPAKIETETIYSEPPICPPYDVVLD